MLQNVIDSKDQMKFKVLLSVGPQRARGQRSFLKQKPMHSFTKALDKHIDNKRIPYNYRDNSKTTRNRTAIKEDQNKLAKYLRSHSTT